MYPFFQYIPKEYIITYPLLASSSVNTIIEIFIDDVHSHRFLQTVIFKSYLKFNPTTCRFLTAYSLFYGVNIVAKLSLDFEFVISDLDTNVYSKRQTANKLCFLTTQSQRVRQFR